MEGEVAGMEPQLKEDSKGLTNNQENAAMASIEERDALVMKDNACQDLRRHKEKLRLAMSWEDKE